MNLYKFHSKPETLDHYDEAHEKVPKLVWEKYKNHPAELKKREKVLARDPKTAYLYAQSVLNGPFPAGEATIAKSAEYVHYYALQVLGKPFPAGEAAIAKSTKYAYFYTLYVLKKPFPAGEAAIAKDATYAYNYARNILKLSREEAQLWVKEHQK